LVLGLSHITFIVKNLERTTMFLERIFEAKEIYSSGDKTFSISKEKFFLINNLWICIMEGEPLVDQTYNHIAFQIQENEIDDYISRIREVGTEIKPERHRVNGEGRSLYFYDFDNHLFELHTGNLNERLACYSMTIKSIQKGEIVDV
jgi:catechol 2,3-dioxygenase-like lactoylglutathione lyase family enzyme